MISKADHNLVEGKMKLRWHVTVVLIEAVD